MLNHRDDHEPADAAAQQVTPEALLRALDAIDARKAKEAAAKDGTVEVGAALSQIGAQVSAEEVYAEILRQRAAAAAAVASPSPRPRRFPPLIISAFALMAIGGIAGIAHRSQMHPPLPAPIPAMPFTPPVAVPVSLPPNTYDYDVDDIAHIPNETPFFCVSSEVQEIFQGVPLAKIEVISEPTDAHNAPWTLVKHGGTPYLHGWISQSLVFPGVIHGNVLIYSRVPDAVKNPALVPVTVNCYALRPLGFFHPTSGLSSPKEPSAEMLSVANVHLDKHAWEKW